MRYIQRDAGGEIVSVHRDDPGFGEALRPGDPELSAFVDPDHTLRSDYARLDLEFVRVLEDVIDTLTTRNVINITDLPESAQAKLFARKSFRERSNANALQLFDNTAFGDVL